jgi:hypothetical protein
MRPVMLLILTLGRRGRTDGRHTSPLFSSKRSTPQIGRDFGSAKANTRSHIPFPNDQLIQPNACNITRSRHVRIFLDILLAPQTSPQPRNDQSAASGSGSSVAYRACFFAVSPVFSTRPSWVGAMGQWAEETHDATTRLGGKRLCFHACLSAASASASALSACVPLTVLGGVPSTPPPLPETIG